MMTTLTVSVTTTTAGGVVVRTAWHYMLLRTMRIIKNGKITDQLCVCPFFVVIHSCPFFPFSGRWKWHSQSSRCLLPFVVYVPFTSTNDDGNNADRGGIVTFRGGCRKIKCVFIIINVYVSYQTENNHIIICARCCRYSYLSRAHTHTAAPSSCLDWASNSVVCFRNTKHIWAVHYNDDILASNLSFLYGRLTHIINFLKGKYYLSQRDKWIVLTFDELIE